MAGLWPQSLNQRLDANGRLMVGAKAYFYLAGTTTPLVTYKDYNLTQEHTFPVMTDGEGTWPVVFLDEEDEFYDVRIASNTGYPIGKFEGLPIIGPTGGGGGGDPGPAVDATALLDTGDVKARYGTGPLAGYVRVNGRTIGNAVSGASERANADTEELFIFLWNNSVNSDLPVSGGRGGDPASDFAANKTITLPDFRGRVLVGLSGMGGSDSGRLTEMSLRRNPNGSGGGTADANKLGDTFGVEGIQLKQSEIPAHTHTMENAGAHTHSYTIFDTEAGVGSNGLTSSSPRVNTHSATTTENGLHKHTLGETGGGNQHANAQPSILVTYYIKL